MAAGVVLLLRGACPLAGVVLGGAAVGAVALAVDGTVALLPAVGLNLLVVLPDGRLSRRGHRALVITAYVVAGAIAVVLWTQRPHPPVWPVAVGAVVAALIGVPLSNRRYQRATGVERQRLQWFGLGRRGRHRSGAGFARPSPSGRLAHASRPRRGNRHRAVATGPGRRRLPPLGRRVDRLLAHTVSLAGLTGVVVAVYLVIVVGLGRAPTRTTSARCSGCRWSRPRIAALLYLPARDRLERRAPTASSTASATRPTRRCARSAAGSPARSRWTSCCCSWPSRCARRWHLAPAEVWTGADGALERAVSVPDRGRGAARSSARRSAPVVARAGVSGHGVAARSGCRRCSTAATDAHVRVAPIAHSGELLGLIVVERPADGDAFTEEDDRVARRAGPPGRPGPAQRAARLGAAGVARRGAPPGRRAAGLARPHRRRGRRRAPQDRAQPARRRPAAPRRAGREPPAGPRRSSSDDRRRPTEMLEELGARRAGHDPGAARPGPRHLPAAAHGQRPGRGAARRGRPERRLPTDVDGRGARPLPGRGRRPPSTSAASRRCRTRASTRATAPRATIRVWREDGGAAASRSPTTAPASTRRPPATGPASST